MAIKELTSQQIESLVGSRHVVTGIEYPPNGLQPYYYWLLRSLHLLAESSAGGLRVAPDDSGDTAVRVSAGRATISSAVISYDGGVVNLGTYNNQTALLWLYNDGGAGAVGVASGTTGWPGSAHLKLAEVTLAAGQITAILDRRFEAAFKV